jgi:hypothetical protein
MNYSLVNRFEGCLLGVVLGEQFGSAVLSQLTNVSSASSPSNLDASKVLSHDGLEALKQNFPLDWSRTLLHGLQGIRQSSDSTLAELRALTSSWSFSALAIASLPIALYYHDDLQRQQQALRQVLRAMAVDAVEQDWLLIFAYAIAQLLKGQFHSAQFLSQIVAYYRVVLAASATPSALVLTELEQVAKCQMELATLTDIRGRLKSADPARDASVPLALIYFLQSPENFRLALTRSALGVRATAQTAPSWPQPPRPHLTACCLTGALVGAHIGSVGIPPAWKLSDSTTEMADLLSPLISEAQRLFIRWSGVYQAAANSKSLAVAAPWVFRGQSPE